MVGTQEVTFPSRQHLFGAQNSCLVHCADLGTKPARGRRQEQVRMQRRRVRGSSSPSRPALSLGICPERRSANDNTNARDFLRTTLGGPRHERSRSAIPSVGWSHEAPETCFRGESNFRVGISGIRNCRDRHGSAGMYLVVFASSHRRPRSNLADRLSRWRHRESGSRASKLVQCVFRPRPRLSSVGRSVVAGRSRSKLPAQIITDAVTGFLEFTPSQAS